MSEIIPLPEILAKVPAGDPCPQWNPGRPFAEFGETPSQIQVTIWGVEHGPLWVPGDGELPDGVYVIPQVPTNSCAFDPQIGFLIQRRVNWGPAGSAMRFRSTTGVGAFFHVAAPRWSLLFKSVRNDHFKFGTATIQIPGTL